LHVHRAIIYVIDSSAFLLLPQYQWRRKIMRMRRRPMASAGSASKKLPVAAARV